jgi:hypothetical protein
MKDNKTISQNFLSEIIQCIEHINYGEVIITIHDSRIVQIARREKKRFKTKSPTHMREHAQQF